MLLSEKLFKRILGSYNSKNGSSEASFYHRKVSDEMKNELIGGQIAKSRVAKKTGDSESCSVMTCGARQQTPA